MASTVWKGYLTFGLISIPIKLFAAARTERVSFHQIHEVCKTRIKQQVFCPHCERVVQRNELAKGYEVDKTHTILIEDEDLKKIAPDSSDTMDIQEFVKAAEIDPIYFDASYFMVPEDGGKKAYHLLLETMNKSGFSAVAKISMHQREYTIVLRPQTKGIMLHTMFYPEEVREVPEYGHDGKVEVKPQEVALAEKLVDGLAGHFDPSKYHDEYQIKVKQMIEAKKEGSEVTASAPRKLAPVIDLMQALQKSLGQLPDRKPASRDSKANATGEKNPPASSKRRSAKAANG